MRLRRPNGHRSVVGKVVEIVKRLLGSGLALAGILMGLVDTGPSVSASIDGESFSGDDLAVNLRWTPCYDFVGPSFECATARVPLDYDRLDAGKIPIDMVRLAATGDRKGSLFLNPGGPGGSGIDFVLGAGPFLYTPEVREAYDLIGFDPRGILRSNPLLCFGTLNASFQAFAPFAFPVDRSEEKVLQAANGFLHTQCTNRGGIIKDKMSTANVARDLEVMRAAVGDEHVNFAGYSYGTAIGQVYANLFPDRVGHIIIDGVLNLEDWVGDTSPRGRDDETLGERLRSDLGAEDTFQEFFRQCDSAGSDACPIGPDSRARTNALLEGLRASPVVVVDPISGEVIFVVTYADVVGAVLGGLYGTNAWVDIGFGLAGLEADLAAVQPSVALRRSMQRLNDAAPHRRPNPKYPNFVEGFPGVACIDTSNPATFRSWSEAADRLSAESPTFGAIWTWGDSVCSGWPGKDRDRFVGTANPLLVLSTRYDPATSLQQAEAARDAIPGSALVTVDGAGHTTLFTSTCVDALTAEYLLRDVLPADGTICDQDLSRPFEQVDETAVRGRAVLLAEAATRLP